MLMDGEHWYGLLILKNILPASIQENGIFHYTVGEG